MVLKKGKRSKKIIKKRSKIVKKNKKSVKKGGKRSFRNKGKGGGFAVPELKRLPPIWSPPEVQQTITTPIIGQYPGPYDNTYQTHIHAPNIPLQYNLDLIIN